LSSVMALCRCRKKKPEAASPATPSPPMTNPAILTGDVPFGGGAGSTSPRRDGW
jgi:hypothetical protein